MLDTRAVALRSPQNRISSLAAAIFFVGLGAGLVFEVNKYTSIEVPLTQVAAKGESDFIEQVKAIYKDGKLDHFELVKSSTQPVPVPTPTP